MKVWDYIVNSAMLGLEKPASGKPDLPEELTAVFDLINSSTELDRESKFLQQASVAYNYRKSGFQPLQKNDLKVFTAENENMPYAGASAIAALSKVIIEDNLALLILWMQLCAVNNQLVVADLLPEVLDKAANHTSLRRMTIDCSGNRGKWLSQFNPEWDYFGPEQSEEEIWLTGKPEERVSLLKTIRLADADRAREMVMQTWPQENASQKLELLKALRQNKQSTDLFWLESLTSEKGKVKDEMQNLLRQIPNSSIVQKYEGFLSEAFFLKKEKALLGMVTKTVLHFKFPEEVDQTIYQSGIEKLAKGNSGFSDEEYTFYQIIQFVPPVFWEKQLAVSGEQVVEYFVKYAEKFVGSLALAVARFHQKHWIPYFLDHKTFYPDFLEITIPTDQEKYLLKFIDSLPNEVLQYALQMSQEWSYAFAAKVLKKMSGEPYRFTLAIYRKKIGLIPVEVLDELENLGPEKLDLIPVWENTKDGLQNLLILKKEVLQAFTDK